MSYPVVDRPRRSAGSQETLGIVLARSPASCARCVALLEAPVGHAQVSLTPFGAVGHQTRHSLRVRDETPIASRALRRALTQGWYRMACDVEIRLRDGCRMWPTKRGRRGRRVSNGASCASRPARSVSYIGQPHEVPEHGPSHRCQRRLQHLILDQELRDRPRAPCSRAWARSVDSVPGRGRLTRQYVASWLPDRRSWHGRDGHLEHLTNTYNDTLAAALAVRST